MLILPKMFRFLFATTLFKCHNKKPGSVEKPSVFFTFTFCTSSWMQFEMRWTRGRRQSASEPFRGTKIMSPISYSACPFTRLFCEIPGLNDTKQNGHQRLIGISILQQERQTR